MKNGDRNHTHVVLGDSRAKLAAAYPSQLVDTICEGLHKHIKPDRFGLNRIATMDQVNAHHVWASLNDTMENANKCNEDADFYYAEDDAAGA